ncbi:MAG: hypothetical protein LBF95_08085 [Treponema sp.]|jgi:hypothetical protein|nr:hypothetical protein [Treponema sp.]
MKKFALVLIVTLALGGVVSAQTTPDFSNPAPQFFSFDLGAGFGFALNTTNSNGFSAAGTEAVGGVGNFGFKIEVLDNFNVGFDSLFTTLPGPTTNLFTGLRLAYNFIPQAGAAIGFGTTGGANGAATFGFYGNFFQNRSASGISTGLRLRIDFVAPFADLGTGKIVFAPVFNIGL